MNGETCRAVSHASWYSPVCGKPVKTTMVGRVDGEDREVSLCGIHANQARKGNTVTIETDDIVYKRQFGGAVKGVKKRIRVSFDATELETLKAELKSLEYGNPEKTPRYEYLLSTVGQVVHQSPGALDCLLAYLDRNHMDEARDKVVGVINKINLFEEERHERIARLDVVRARLKELGYEK